MILLMKTEVIITKITDENIQKVETFMPFISKKRRYRLNQYRFPIDKALSLYAEILVRQKACEILRISNDNIIFEQNQYKKPYLKNYNDFHFNISHTHNSIAVAFSNSEIGVDIEKIRERDLQIIQRIFSLQEREYILSADNQDMAFYEIWTRKEAYIKYLGKSLFILLKSFDTMNNEINKIIKTVVLHNNVISVCSDLMCEEISINEISIYSLMPLAEQ